MTIKKTASKKKAVKKVIRDVKNNQPRINEIKAQILDCMVQKESINKRINAQMQALTQELNEIEQQE